MKAPISRRWLVGLSLVAAAAAGLTVAALFPLASDPSEVVITDIASSIKTSGARPSDGAAPEAHQAPSLNALLPGIEAKVAANPKDFDLRLLLAQTYLELDQKDKAAAQLKILRKQAPDDPQVAVFLARATVEALSNNELRLLLRALAPIAKAHPQLAVDVYAVRGQAHARLGERDAARREWTLALAELPPGDGRRGLIEMQLAHLKR